MSEPPANGPAPARGVLEALRATAATPAIRWNRVLVWFLRMMAVIWLAMGLMAWADVLGILPAAVPFEARSEGAQATVIYFAVIDLVAAVGLWLTSTWGGVMWLLAVMSQLILTIFLPRAVASGGLTIAIFVVLILVYLTISWLAAQEET